jgi:hypothetical protein
VDGEHVALVKVVSHDNLFMDVVVLDEIRHTFSEDTITIIGQDGLNCSEYLNIFEVSDTLILGLQDFGMGDTMNLSYCGRYYLFYNNGHVQGNINPIVTSQSYIEFTTNFDACTILSVNEDELPPIITVENHHDVVIFSSIEQPIISIRIFNTLGALIYSQENLNRHSVNVNISALKPAVSLFEIETDTGKSVRKLFIH